jgi:DNA uptake protein ComE-like DNA-binding protein
MCVGLLACLLACSPPHKQNPDEVRERTADATATLKENAKAVAQGVREGLSRGSDSARVVDLNSASKGDLLTLPGVNSDHADRIIASRPFDNTRELVTRKILSPEAYDRVKDRVTVKQ